MTQEVVAVEAGMDVVIQLRSEGYLDAAERYVFHPHPPARMTVLDREVCAHAESICTECFPEWATDWFVYYPPELRV